MKIKLLIYILLMLTLLLLLSIFIGQESIAPYNIALLIGYGIFSLFLLRRIKDVSLSKEDKISQLSDRIKSLEKQLHYLENHDQLTGLANREAIKNYLDDLYGSRHHDTEFAFIYVEIDRFKHINDTLGHLKGDQLLQLISQRIKEVVPEGSLVGRQGGDEFIIILHGLNIDIVSSYLEQIQRSFQAPFELDGMELYALPSIGMSMFPHHAESLSTLVSYADVAMYTAKEQGGNRFVIYSDHMNKLSKENIRLEGKLHKAIENGRIETFYQPQVNALTNDIIGAEALIRWKDDELGYIPPNKFIPIAEETGLIEKIFQIVIDNACHNISKWNAELEIPIKVSVNLSSKQFYYPDKLVRQVLDTLSKYQVNPEWLELEITESILMAHTEATTKALNELKDRGIQISVDDFGTGYSSLSYLKDLPIDKLKIDQSFIKGMNPELNNETIAIAIINLARSLNLGIIAEGVEYEYQKRLLMSNHCLEMQGYLFSKPVPIKDFEDQLFCRNS